MTWIEHRDKWISCRRCPLAQHRKRVCLARGPYGTDGKWMMELPSEILFVGEAPGQSEDSTGDCFTGPAGHLLDSIAEEAGALEHVCVWTNVCACIPIVDGDKAAKPPESAMRACLPRLKEFVALADPKLVVLVGDVAQKWVGRYAEELRLTGVPTCEVIHPAAILRGALAGRGLAIRRCVLTLRKAVSDAFGNRLFD